MRRVTCHQGQLQIDEPSAAPGDQVAGDVSASLLSLEVAQVHELLSPSGVPRHVAVWLARNHMAKGAVMWCEAGHGPYAPAMHVAGLPLERVYWVRPKNHAEAMWAMTESLRCPAISITIGMPERLTRVEARRLQLAAERGGGIGLLLRRPTETIHAARTRWLVRPAPGEPLVQRWRLSLVHGHGRPADQDVLLEVHRETHHVHTTAVLADRPRQASPARMA